VPKEKKVEWDVGRINYWLGVGAQPTKSVVKLLERVSWTFFASLEADLSREAC